ncbi:MAG TPA: ABC transporter ATP-binding protein [Allosphingosinicella sp.]|jgi:iron complex transport system ATP-binding protein|nr:ABC transporter ATP-binding protein [Allosphingosinicella sp.]
MTALLEAGGAALAGRLAPTDFVVGEPALVCLVGPNGSGKTSLLHALARIGGAMGEVRIRGRRPEDLAPAARRRLLSFLPASRDVAWPLSALDLVRLGASEAEAEEAMAALDLAPWSNRRVDRLSTGERSRVLIARALAPKPLLLLLDEPVANLDPLWQLRLMEHLRLAVAGGQGAVVAMHDLDLAGRYSDRLVLMESGAIVADGDPKAVLGSARLGQVFGIERVGGEWRPLCPPSPDEEVLSRPEDRRSSP